MENGCVLFYSLFTVEILTAKLTKSLLSLKEFDSLLLYGLFKLLYIVKAQCRLIKILVRTPL